MPLTVLRELTLPTQKALTSRDQKTFLWRFHFSIEVGTQTRPQPVVRRMLKTAARQRALEARVPAPTVQGLELVAQEHQST